jgi:uncharacterized cofD-like protein
MKSNNKNKRIVVIGGGTGLFTLLSGLKRYTNNITAVVTMFDSGGSSGILRAELGVLPPGDIRRCLIALADSPTMYRLFEYRFNKGRLNGHSFGNLLLTALTDISGGNMAKAVEELGRILAIRGNVLPVTLNKTTLCARLKSGKLIRGEAAINGYDIHAHAEAITRSRSPIKEVFLSSKARPYKKVLDAIKRAELVVLGPGSLYTSVIPNLLVSGIPEAIATSKAIKVYVCNVMTQAWKTEHYSASKHVEEIERYLGKGVLDYVIVNTGSAPEKLLAKYRKKRAEMVKPDIAKIAVPVLKANLVKHSDLVRHNPEKLAALIIDIAKKGSQKRQKASLR